ncbi:MAG: hypothetical protein V4654_03295 [Bdellovibrionota bacterium]
MKAFLFSLFFFVQVKVHAEWNIDLSRRQTDFTRIQNQRMPSATNMDTSSSKNDADILEALKKVVNPFEPSQEIVILQTEKGFVPEMIHLKKNDVYKVHVVNLNLKEKNVSFVMDAFSQTHNTVYGLMKTFTIQPKIEGVYSFQSPETGYAGKVVIIPDTVRKIASEKSPEQKTQEKVENQVKASTLPTDNSVFDGDESLK